MSFALLLVFALLPLLAVEAVGTFGVLTGNIGELVLDRLPKNRLGFSGLGLSFSNLALPLATAPEIEFEVNLDITQ